MPVVAGAASRAEWIAKSLRQGAVEALGVGTDAVFEAVHYDWPTLNRVVPGLDAPDAVRPLPEADPPGDADGQGNQILG